MTPTLVCRESNRIRYRLLLHVFALEHAGWCGVGMYFERGGLKELHAALIKSFESADAFFVKRIAMVEDVLNDPGKAPKHAEAIRSGGGDQTLWDSAAREPMIEHLLEKARREFNDSLVQA